MLICSVQRLILGGVLTRPADGCKRRISAGACAAFRSSSLGSANQSDLCVGTQRHLCSPLPLLARLLRLPPMVPGHTHISHRWATADSCVYLTHAQK